jgi:hypothetical protein
LKLIFEKGLNEVFGFQQTTLMGGEEMYSSNVSVIPYFNDNYSLFIYSYICEYQLVGDNEAPLLQFVSTTNVNENYVEKIFDLPHFIPLARNNLENIEGIPIHFQTGKVVVKLHFKRKNYYSI